MTRIFTTLFTFATLNYSAQTITLSGHVKLDSGEAGKIYFTEEGSRFSKNRFIPYDQNGSFTFRLDLSKSKNTSSQVLVFATDTTQQTMDVYACVQRINISSILNSAEFYGKKEISLKTDLSPMDNCTQSELYTSKMENKDRFVGSYRFQINDTIRHIRLEDTFFRYRSTFSKATNENMSEEFGSWNYNEEKKILIFYIFRQSNQRFGTLFRKAYNFEFDVKEDDQGIHLTPRIGIGSITKL